MASTLTASVNMPPWMEGEDVQEDEWFFQSIKRYDHLFIYHLSMLAKFMRISPKGDKIAIVGKTIKSKDQGISTSMEEFVEIGVFSICPKLLVTCLSEQGLNNKRDFALLAGARTTPDSPDIKQIRFLTEMSIVTVSAKYVDIWQINEGTDLLTPIGRYKNEAGTLVGCEVFDSSHIYCFDESTVIRLSADIDTGDIKTMAKTPFHHSTILDLAFTGHVVCVITSDGLMTSLECEVLTHEKEVNLASCGLSRAVICKSDPTVVAFVSFGALQIRLADGRIVFRRDMNGINASLDHLNFDRRDCLLLRDDKVVEVYRAGKDYVEELFTHDGHRYEVTCVCTHPKVKGLHFSSDLNGSLHAWLYATPTSKEEVPTPL